MNLSRKDPLPVGHVLDQLWDDLQVMSRNLEALPADYLKKIRQIRRAQARVTAAKLRKRTGRESERQVHKLSIQAINPARCFRNLASRGLLERTGAGITLTDLGRSTADAMPDLVHRTPIA
jgi:hypothetical protein